MNYFCLTCGGEIFRCWGEDIGCSGGYCIECGRYKFAPVLTKEQEEMQEAHKILSKALMDNYE